MPMLRAAKTRAAAGSRSERAGRRRARSVDFVVIWWPTADDALRAVRPSVYVKGGDSRMNAA
jgi:bifunctional ADP-heptose synthase (sugar kinase/adenylyltransferase)